MNVNQTYCTSSTIETKFREEGDVLTHRHFPGIQLSVMGNLLILHRPQRIQRFIPLVPRLPQFG